MIYCLKCFIISDKNQCSFIAIQILFLIIITINFSVHILIIYFIIHRQYLLNFIHHDKFLTRDLYFIVGLSLIL